MLNFRKSRNFKIILKHWHYFSANPILLYIKKSKHERIKDNISLYFNSYGSGECNGEELCLMY